jgi:tetratricopeptide (TPR) repeat protein
MAAVQGYQFDVEVTRRALQQTQDVARATLGRLLDAHMVEAEGAAHRFTNHELFDHIHDALHDAELETSHAATADAFLEARDPGHDLPADVHGVLAYRVAWHHLLAGKGERGLPYLGAALSHLRSTWRLLDADRLCELAIRALAGTQGAEAELFDITMARAEILAHQGRRAEQREQLGEALLRAREMKDTAREARALFEQARLRFVMGRFQEAASECDEALSAARRAGDASLEARCEGLHAGTAFQERRHRDARGHAAQMLEIARRCGDTPSEAEALQTLGTLAHAAGTPANAEDLLQMAAEAWRKLREPGREADALAALGNVALAAGEPARAEELLRRALATARSVGDDQGEARMLVHLGLALQDGGRLPEAREVHAQCLEAARRTGTAHTEVVALVNLATTEYLLGRLHEARSSYGDAMRLARELREARLQAYALTGLAEVSRQGGTAEVARGLFVRAVAKFRGGSDPGGLAAALLGAGRLEVVAGEASRAGDLLAEARDVATSHDVRSVAALAVAYLGLVNARCGADEEALSALAESGAMVEEAETPAATRIEMLFVHALVLRVLLRGLEADRKLLQAEALLMRTTAELPPEDRRRVLGAVSPHREIVAGAAVAHAATAKRESELSGTVAV